MQITLYAVAGPVPELIVAFMVGIGLSSFLVNMLKIILHASFMSAEKDPTRKKSANTIEALIFFGISTLFMAFCTVLSFLVLKKNEAY